MTLRDMCTDNRFELIERFKKKLIESTNIETSPEEMKVLDNILLRFWQMGWLYSIDRMLLVKESAKILMHSGGDSASAKAFRNAGRLIQNAIDGEAPEFEMITSAEPERYDDSYTGTYIKEEDALKFYYVESLDDYWIGRRLDNFYYATWDRDLQNFVWSKSRYLPWGEHIVAPDTLWKEHTYPSEPKEIPLKDWLKGFYAKYFMSAGQPERKKGELPEEARKSAEEYCEECNHIEMCGWYPYEGCEFRSIPSAQPKQGENPRQEQGDPDKLGVKTGETCEDCISRQAAIDAINEDADWLAAQGSDWQVERMERDKSILKSLPSAQPERPKGRWIRITQGAMPEQYICPFCHRTVESYGVEELLSIRYPYCHCGADMRGDGNG